VRAAPILLCLVLSACLPVPPPETPEPPVVETPEPEQATLAVVVTDAASGAPVSDARVELHTGESGTTNRDGYVAFPALLLGERGVTVQRAGYYAGFASIDLDGNTDMDFRLEPVHPPPPPPPPIPEPRPPVPDACAPAAAPTVDRLACARQVAVRSSEWPRCATGSGVACHRYTREVARALAAGDPRWGLITKQPGQQQCSMTSCGPGDGTGYGEDVVAYLPAGSSPDRWVGHDIVGGAGAPGARVQWAGPLERRPGNLWAPVP
jgi:hypothetical protein